MNPPQEETERLPVPVTRSFAQTRWSEVVAAGAGEEAGASEALASLCRGYWFPVYAYVRRSGHGPEAAQDLTQEFFCRLVERRIVSAADPAKGRFRTFLLTVLKRYLINAREAAGAIKRGGRCEFVSLDSAAEERYGLEPADRMSADVIYDRRWALSLLETVMGRLREEQESEGRGALFGELAPFLYGEPADTPQEVVGDRHGLSASAIKSHVYRLRQRYRELLRDEVQRTLSNPLETESELAHLLQALRSA